MSDLYCTVCGRGPLGANAKDQKCMLHCDEEDFAAVMTTSYENAYRALRANGYGAAAEEFRQVGIEEGFLRAT